MISTLVHYIYFVIICIKGVMFQPEMRNECSGKCVTLNECPSAIRSWSEYSIQPTICYFDERFQMIAYICCKEQKLKTCPVPHPSDINTDLGSRITFGKNADPAEFPFMVALSWDTPFGKFFGCGGTLIHKFYVLTAAHCLYNNGTYRPLRYAVIGAESIKRGNSVIQIISVTQHPQYTPKKKYNDIAILRLAKEVNTQTACIPSPNEVLQPGSAVIATGYGRKAIFDDISDVLLRADLRIYDQFNCTQYYGNLIQSQLCALSDPAYVPNRTLPVFSDTCQGDSGGPLIREGSNSSMPSLVVGIISFGFPCGNGYPGVYTKVSSYYNWINSKIYPR